MFVCVFSDTGESLFLKLALMTGIGEPVLGCGEGVVAWGRVSCGGGKRECYRVGVEKLGWGGGKSENGERRLRVGVEREGCRLG